jgi:indole-3-glycerol phosphate synthase
VETILDRIIQEKRKEVQKLREENLTKLETKPKRPKRSLIQKLQEAGEIAIISEFKRASPSKGIINNEVEPAEQAIRYEQAGASAISVLTDSTFFKGSFSDLRAVREVVNLPILCKDFMIDSSQIDMAAKNGADIILLIVAALDENTLGKLYQYARVLGLEVLVEVHNQAELEKALQLGARLIGVNNRDLKTFNVSLEATETLAKSIKDAGAFLISESGIHKKEDVERVRNAGANGILVGEALMKSPDLTQAFKDFILPLAGGTLK